MTNHQLAEAFTQAVRDDNAAAYQSMWSDNIVSIEPGDGPMSRVEGRAALLEKHAWWYANAEVHSATAEGPFVTGDQFVIRLAMDVTMEGERSQMEEIGLYTIADGKIAEERFFYGAGQ